MRKFSLAVLVVCLSACSDGAAVLSSLSLNDKDLPLNHDANQTATQTPVSYGSKADNTANDDAVKSGNAKYFMGFTLAKIIQSKDKYPDNSLTIYDDEIYSPKSATFTTDGKKFYIQSLEGMQTVVYDAKTFKKLKTINHKFDDSNQNLFKNGEQTVFDYTYRQARQNYNHFSGKPVEATLSHGGRYLWVSYYRRNWDDNAESPSAVAIIDTTTDKIVRVMPSGPLPKMLATSPDNRYIAVTHWGDNTVGLIDISSDNPQDFQYVSHIVIDNRMPMNFSGQVNRDTYCGNCLRGTVFTPDGSKLLVGKMGGNGIAVIDVAQKSYVGTIVGAYPNIRHLVISNGKLILSSNKLGVVQSADLADIFAKPFDASKQIHYTQWQNVHVGAGARTIVASQDGNLIFAAVNNEAKVVAIDGRSMKIVGMVSSAKFPVGMALSPDETQLVVTAQGKSDVIGAGNTVTVYNVGYF